MPHIKPIDLWPGLRGPAQRKSARGSHVDSLDGRRCHAVGSLLIGNFRLILGMNLGSIGFDLFFVLSRCVMTRLLFLRETPVETFYRRRMSRNFAKYYVFIAVMVGPFAWLSMLIACL